MKPFLRYLFFCVPFLLPADDLPVWINRFLTGDDQILSRLTSRPHQTLTLLRSGWVPPELDEAETKTQLEQLGAETYRERQAATEALIAMGGGIVPLVEAHLQAHAGDPEVVHRCRMILNHVSPIEWVDWHADAYAPRIFHLLLSRESWPAEDLEPFHAHYLDILSNPGDRARLNRLRALHPNALRNFIRHSLHHEALAPKLSDWAIHSRHAEVSRELAYQRMVHVLADTLTLPAGTPLTLPEILDRVLQPSVRDRLHPGQWRELADAIAITPGSSLPFLEILKQHQPLPRELRQQADRLIQAPAGQHRLLGAWLSPDATWERQRPRTIALIRNTVPPHQWSEHLPIADFDPDEILQWLSLRARFQLNHNDPTATQLATLTDPLPDSAILTALTNDAANVRLLEFFARRRPQLQSAIGDLFCDELQRAEAFAHFNALAQGLRQLPPLQCPLGTLDENWRAHFADPDNHTHLFRNAPTLGIRPEHLWQKMQAHPQWMVPDQGMIFRNNMFHLLETAKGELARDVLTHFTASLDAQATAGNVHGFLDRVLQMDSAGHPVIFEQQAAFFLQLLRTENSPDLLAQMLSNPFLNKRHRHPQAYVDTHLDDIRRLANAEITARTLLPMICVFAMDDELRERHRDLWVEILRKGLPTLEDDPQLRFAIAFVSILLDMEHETLTDDFTTYLLAPESTYTLARFLFLLDDTFAALIPGLLQAATEAPVPNHPLQAALFINPDHPEVRARILQHILHHEDRHTAGALLDRLRIFDTAPPLTAYPQARIDEFFDIASEEDVAALIHFLTSLSSEEHGQVLERVLNALPQIAEHSGAFHNLGFFMEHLPRRHERVLPRLFEMLAATETPQSSFAANHFLYFSDFTPEQLQTLWNAFERFQNHRNGSNLRNQLLIAISNAGDRAAFLAPHLRRQAENTDERRRYQAWRALANISPDPAVKAESVEALLKIQKEAPFPSAPVRALGFIDDMEDVISPILYEIVRKYLDPDAEDRPTERTAREALWGLARVQADDQLFDFYQAILNSIGDGKQSARLAEQVLWCLRTHYPERLEASREAVQALPTRLRASLSYRMTLEMLRRLP